MKLEQLYRKNIKLWPEEINISDGYPTSNNGYYFPTLSNIYHNIEDNFNSKTENWTLIFNWAFFQAVHAESKILILNGEKILEPKKVKKENIDNLIKRNLKNKDWEKERKSYIGL